MDPTYILLFVALAAFIVFQVFQGRKRKRETESRQSKFVPGVEIMTNYGVYGTIVSIDEERNLVMLETSPGVEMKIHRQTILKIADYDDIATSDDAETDDTDIDSTDTDSTDETRDAATRGSATSSSSAIDEGEPEFGERLDRSGDTRADTSRGDGADRKSGDGTAK